MDVKFPEVEVQLTDVDGSAFGIIGRVISALKRADVDKADVDEFFSEAVSGDYDHVLQTAMQTVTVL